MKIALATIPVVLWLALWLMPTSGVAIPLSNPNNQHNFSYNSLIDENPRTGKPHPRADSPANDGTTEICVFCHTPHSARPQTPLWNRPDPASDSSVPSEDFPLYGGALVIKGSFNVEDAVQHSQYQQGPNYPNGASKLCLSCHDGVTAIGTVIDGTAFNMLNAATVGAINDPRLVINLATSHPISFVYDSQVHSDIDKVKPGQYTWPPALADVPLDGQARMQCTTCHDPHEDTRGALNLPFWRHRTNISVNGPFEDVCNACHVADKAGKLGDLHDNL